MKKRRNRMKAILVIDMPRNCWGCPCNEVDSDGMSWCNALVKNTIHSNVERQPWCPLKPMPDEAAEALVNGLDLINKMGSIEVRKVIRTE